MTLEANPYDQQVAPTCTMFQVRPVHHQVQAFAASKRQPYNGPQHPTVNRLDNACGKKRSRRTWLDEAKALLPALGAKSAALFKLVVHNSRMQVLTKAG